MAIVYLRSTDGNDADDGSTWALAKATLAAALTAAGAGGTVYVSQAHAETQAGAMVLTSPGTEASPVLVVCVSDAAEPPTTRASTATVTVSGAAVISFRGSAYSYGVDYLSAHTLGAFAVGASSTVASWSFDEVLFSLTASASNRWSLGGSSSGSIARLRNCVFKFANVGARIRVGGKLIWTGNNSSVDASGSIPTFLFDAPGGLDAAIAVIEGVDLSALGSGKALVGVTAADSGDFLFLNCKLGSSVSILSGAIAAHGGVRVRLINCDSGDTQYRYAQALYEGMETSETTIVRSGGATDRTTPIALKIVTTAGASARWPYESLPMEFWNESLSALTVTIPVLTDNVTLTDAEAWLEVEYLGTSGFPLGVFASDRVADPIFGTPANQTTDATSSWTTTGLGTPVKQSLSVTFTPAEKGIVRARVCIAKASTTVYYDPKALTTSARQYQSTAGYVNEGGLGAQPNIFDSAIIRAVHP